MFFSDLLMEIMPGSDALTCLNHGKYKCFHEFSLFGFIRDFGVPREALGPLF